MCDKRRVIENEGFLQPLLFHTRGIPDNLEEMLRTQTVFHLFLNLENLYTKSYRNNLIYTMRNDEMPEIPYRYTETLRNYVDTLNTKTSE